MYCLGKFSKGVSCPQKKGFYILLITCEHDSKLHFSYCTESRVEGIIGYMLTQCMLFPSC